MRLKARFSLRMLLALVAATAVATLALRNAPRWYKDYQDWSAAREVRSRAMRVFRDETGNKPPQRLVHILGSGSLSHWAPVYDIGLTGDQIISCGHDRAVRCWSTETSFRHRLSRQLRSGKSPALHFGGTSGEGRFLRCEPSGMAPDTLPCLTNRDGCDCRGRKPITSQPSFVANGDLVLYSQSGDELYRQAIGPAQASSSEVRFSPDGRYIALINGNGTCYLLRNVLR